MICWGDCSAPQPAATGQFLLTACLRPLCSVAEACGATLAAMNPLIKVVVQPGSAATLTGAALQPYDTVIVSARDFSQVERMEALCSGAGGVSRQPCLLEHKWGLL